MRPTRTHPAGSPAPGDVTPQTATTESELRRLANFQAGRLQSGVAIVTGAGMHDSGPIGTGAAIALLFGAHGARIVVVDSNNERGLRTCRSICENGGEALLVEGDVTDERTSAMAVEAARSTWGRIDVLVNNVGISPAGNLVQVALEDWDAAYRTNVTSALLMMRAAADDLAQTSGSVVNISSIAAIRPFGRDAYTASKAALIGLTRSAAYGLGPRGIRVNCILPGHIHASMSAAVDPESRERRRLATMLGTEGTAWDVAATALFLASGDARWVTGVVLPVDAGTTSLAGLATDGLHGYGC